jgi:DNA-binding transcriptional MerR regulator
VSRLKFVRHARELGFGIDEIRELLKLSDNPDTSCAAADTIAKSHLEQVEIRITKLKLCKRN